MDIYETPIVTYKNIRPIQYCETKSPQSGTPTVPPMILKEYKTPRWMVKAMIGMAVLIAVMLAGIVVGIVMITREREEIKEIRNEYLGTSLARKQDARIVSLEKILTTMNTSVQQAYRKLEQVESDSDKLNNSMRALACNIRYDSKCYLPLKKPSNHASASELCKEFGGGLANIYSSDHLLTIMKSIRQTKMNGRSSVFFYLGMNIVPSNGSVTLSDGAAAPDLKWHDSYPLRDSSSTCLWLCVNMDSSSIYQYLLNVRPRNSAFVLCEIA